MAVKMKMVALRMPAETHDRLEKLAETKYMAPDGEKVSTVSNLIRSFIDEGLASEMGVDKKRFAKKRKVKK